MTGDRLGGTVRVVAVFLVLIIAYVVVLVALASAFRQESALVPQVVTKETALTDAQRSQGGSVETLQRDLALVRERYASVRARVPTDVQVNDLFERTAQAAQRNGIADFRFQRKGEAPESMKAGVYKVYRFSISGRGPQEKMIAFLDALHKDAGATMVLENVSLSISGGDWQMSADIAVYTLGG